MARVVNVTQGVIYYSGRPALCLWMGCYIHVIDNSGILYSSQGFYVVVLGKQAVFTQNVSYPNHL